MEKWQQEIEELLTQEYLPSEAERKQKVRQDILEHLKAINKPDGADWDVIQTICNAALNTLAPRSAFYAAFQVGIAYERYKNAQRSSGKS